MSPGNVANNGHLTSVFPAWPERIKMQTVLNDRGNVLKSDVPFIQYLLRSYRPKLSKNTFVVSSSSSKTACSHPCRRVFTNTDDHLESRLFLQTSVSKVKNEFMCRHKYSTKQRAVTSQSLILHRRLVLTYTTEIAPLEHVAC